MVRMFVQVFVTRAHIVARVGRLRRRAARATIDSPQSRRSTRTHLKIDDGPSVLQDAIYDNSVDRTRSIGGSSGDI